MVRRRIDRSRRRTRGSELAEHPYGRASILTPVVRLRFLVALALALVASTASAQEALTVRLSVERAPGAERCPDDELLRDAVRARLGRDPFDDASRIAVRVSFVRSGRAWRGRIERTVDGAPAGARELEVVGRDCEELAQAVTLAIGIAVDPIALAELAGAEPEPLPEPPPEPVTTPSPALEEPARVAPEEPPPPETPPPAPSVAFRVVARGGLAALVAPEVNATFALGAGLSFDALSVALEARIDVPSRAGLPNGGSVEAHVIGVTLAPCAHIGPVALCGLVSVGVLRIRAAEDALGQGDVAWAAGGARVGVEVPIGDVWYFGVVGDGLVTFTETVLALDERVVWVSSPISLVLSAGLGATIP